jgi:hypothetical protein
MIRNFQFGLVWLLLFSLVANNAKAEQQNFAKPKVYRLNADWLATSKQKLAAGDPALKKAYEKLLAEADQALQQRPVSVMEKTVAPPSGDKHDFASFARYWWPNPNTKDGLPYVRRDGYVNPEGSKEVYDRRRLSTMIDSTSTLALAYYFSGEEKYAAHAAKFLRTWFLDPATRMNPNLKFAQAIPGICEGRGIGLIGTASLGCVIDSMALIEKSPAFTEADRAGMKKWFADYLDWLLTSEHGKQEIEEQNNHGSWFDVQLVNYALYVGNTKLAKETAEKAKAKRIAAFIEPDGRQPAELARTQSFGYSVFDLSALFTLARLVEHVDVDLWNYTTEDKRCLRVALDYLAPYTDPAKKWPHEQIHEISFGGLATLLRHATIKYPNADYQKFIAKLPEELRTVSRDLLIYPAK